QSVYEVTAVVHGALIDVQTHLKRLERSLTGVDLPLPMSLDEIEAVQTALIRKNALSQGVIYLQITAGDYRERDFAGSRRLRPRLFAFCQARPLIDEKSRNGVGAITVPDTRWARRDLKTTQLLSQVLAYRRAHDADAFTAIMHEDGMVTEAASANVWIVDRAGDLQTRNLSAALLGGVTRAAVLRLAEIPVRELAFSLDDLRAANEVFLSSSGGMILPVTHIDAAPVGTGKPGPVTRNIQRAYYQAVGFDVAADAPWALP
ncbi:MAG: aminotransferase class IV, partial [Pseudomonadota bacterium]